MPAQTKILIVDDDASSRLTLESALAPLNYQCVLAANGREGLRLAAETDPDLIVLDVMMPDMDGFEVCRNLRARPHHAEVPILLVTALDDRASRLQGIEAGADDFLNKPIDRVELRTRVHSVARLNRYRRLLAERSKFEWLAEDATEGCLLLDANGRIEYANAEARRWLRAGDGPDAKWEDSFLAHARKEYQLEPADAWDNWPAPGGNRCLLRPESPAERRVWLSVETHSPRTGPGHSLVVRLRDITETVERHQDTWKLRTFLCHKLRTPLIGLKGGMDLLEEAGNTLAPEEVSEMVALVRQSGRRLQGEIEDLLQFIDAPRLAGLGAGFALAELEKLARDQAASLGLATLEVQIAPGLADRSLGIGRQMLELIFAEVFGNSLKFHPQGAPAMRVTVSRASDAHARLTIQDDGATLSPARLARIGVPFFQGEKFFTGELPGMGLGLAMIRSLACEVGGDCRVSNVETGPGVRVTIDLPLYPDE